MITLHGEEVKVGDRVWHVRLGWGEVRTLDNDNDTNYPILVHWGGRGWFEWFTKDGKIYPELDETPLLFWQPIEFKIPKKPKKKEKAWQWLYIEEYVEVYGITYSHYSSAEDFYSKYPRGSYTAVEPYLPSEIEREVKE